ncbi:hypothetical protein POVCU2_0015490 [Plasmodium ovale curtisi]|uniref:PIR Superfamily Protein n=1 Tax=Plasmodium ovale curtisi TaxID=864141 RepID=A0A1A8VT07_PLAOA|nr:hypothetical protein POVCU2_0015490 [Plasmodium ovale curtisi]
MEEIWQDERFKSNIGDECNSFPYSVIPENINDREFIVRDFLSSESPEQQTGIIVRQGSTRGQHFTPEDQETVGITEDHATSPISVGSTIPITIFSSGIGVLLILLSFYKFHNNRA